MLYEGRHLRRRHRDMVAAAINDIVQEVTARPGESSRTLAREPL